MSKWVHQAHQVLRLACATIAKDGCGWREAEHASRGKSSASLEVANLPGLAMRIMVALTDTSTWKCFCESGQEARKKKADQVVLSLAEWLANGNGGLFLAVRAYLLANYPVPGIKDEQIRPHGRKDKFIVTASIITVMLRPLLLLSVASVEDQDQNSEGSSERVQFKASAARAAAQLSAHILTIPFLSQRLPSSLLPALKHPSALFPCIRALGVSHAFFGHTQTPASVLIHILNQIYNLFWFALTSFSQNSCKSDEVLYWMFRYSPASLMDALCSNIFWLCGPVISNEVPLSNSSIGSDHML